MAQLTWIGSGIACSPIFNFEKFNKVNLIEANQEICIQLEKRFDLENIYIYNYLVTDTSGYSDFFIYSLQGFSATTPAKDINKLFPGLRIEEKQIDRETIDIVTVLNDLKLTGRDNVLRISVIDIAYFLLSAIFKHGYGALLNTIHIDYANSEAYENMRCFSELDILLNLNSFELCETYLDDPDFPQYRYIKNTDKEKLQEAIAESEELKKKLESQKLLIRNLELKLNEANASLTEAVRNLQSDIKKSTTLVSKQVEASIAIQSYLSSGLKPLNFHGWPISADLGAYLVDSVDDNDYDFVIEFGSGTSTLLLAKTLIAKEKFRGGNASTKLISFDHHEKYYNITKNKISKEGLSQKVDLVYAPLIETVIPELATFSYYDCDEKLSQLNAEKKSGYRILVLIDGPPANTGKHARYPAIPKLIKYLPNSSFTVLLDDFNRREEKEVVSLWKDYLDGLGYSSELTEIECEKGLAVLTF